MKQEVKMVAFDLGGVLAYQDLSRLTQEELFLLRTYMNRDQISNKELLEYAKEQITEIYLKIHKLNPEAISTLKMLQEYKIRPSIWTNNIKEIVTWFEAIDIYKYVKKEDIVNSIYLGVNKPHLEFYQRALLLLKINPNDILFFDDNHLNIVGARICGINGIEYEMGESLKNKVKKKIIKGAV